MKRHVAIASVPILVLLATLAFPGNAAGQGGVKQELTAPAVPAPNLKDVGVDQRLNEQIPMDLVFTDESGKPVRLADYFTDKPVILVLAYYRCPMLCTLVLNGLVETMRDIPFTLGKDFRVVTVSFDPRETPEMAAVKRQNYLKSYGRPGTAQGWHFLTGKEDSIRRLTQAVGFRYTYDAKNDQYIHPSGITILTPSGKISRYFFGIQYSPRDLRLSLVEAGESKIGSPTDQVLLYCFHYDPNTGKYTPSVLNFVRVGGVLVIVAVAGFFWFLVRTGRRRRALVQAEGAASAPPPPPASQQGDKP